MRCIPSRPGEQGAPLDAVLFCVGILPALRNVCHRCQPGTLAIANADKIHLEPKEISAQTVEDISALRKDLQKANIELAPGEPRARPPRERVVTSRRVATCRRRGSQPRPRCGIEVVGVPDGPKDYTRARVQTFIEREKLPAEVRHVAALEDKQVDLLIARISLGSKDSLP